MNTTSLIIGIIPIVVFIVVDAFSGLKTALIAACFFALIEVAASVYMFGEIDSVTIISLLLVLILSYVSLKKQSATFFKFQPVVLSTLFGLVLVGSYILGSPYIFTFAMKYKSTFPMDAQLILDSPFGHEVLKQYTLFSGLALFAHAAITAWAAIKLNKWWWAAIRVICFYLFIILGMIIAMIVTKIKLGA